MGAVRSISAQFKMSKVRKLQSATDSNVSGLLQVTADILWSMSIGIDDDSHVVFAGQFPER